MKIFLVFGTIMTIIFLSIGCASTKGTVVSGIVVGGTTGGMTGLYLGKRNRERAALQGTIVGGVTGGLLGYLIHRALETRDKKVRREIFFSLDKFDVRSKGISNMRHGLTTPKVEVDWVDTQVRGKRLIEGHRVWTIMEDPQWVPDSKPKSRAVPKKIQHKTKNKKKRIKKRRYNDE